MRKLHIIMPMAGEGSRFSKMGIISPKPLIEVDGIKMFQRSLNSLKELFDLSPKLTLIIKNQFRKEFTEISGNFESIDYVHINEKTKGPLDSVFKAEEKIKDDEALLILDCDLSFSSKEYFNFIRESLKNPNSLYAGALPWFNAKRSIYCFASIQDGLVKEIAEKKKISPSAIAGAYFFSRGEFFKTGAKKIIHNEGEGELFISLVYKYLLKNDFLIKAFKLDKYYSFGTPKELGSYLEGNYGNY